jgi:Ca-activated chloride channel homolog
MRVCLPVVWALLSGCVAHGAKTAPPDELVAQRVDEAVSEPAPAVRLGLAAQLERTVVRGEGEPRLWMRVRVDAPVLPSTPRPPAHVALVLDTSGSMQGQPIETLRAAAAGFVDALADGDQVTIVAFGSRPELVLAPTVLDANTRRAAVARVRELEAHGTTDLAGGLQMALDVMPTGADSETLDRIVLLSDGVPNEPVGVGLADQTRSRGMSITCLGLGLEFDESLLGQIAQRSGGRFHFLESSEEIAAVLANEVLEIDRIAARELTLTLTPGPGISLTRAIGRELTPVTAHARRIALGDLGESQSREVMVELAVPPHHDGAAVELVDLHLSFRSTTGRGEVGPSVEQAIYVGARASTDPGEIESSRDPELAASAAEIEAADVTVRAVAMARAGQLDQAHRIVDAMVERLSHDIEAFDAPQLRAALDGLVALRPTLVTAVPSRAAPPSHAASPTKAMSAQPHGAGAGKGLRSSGLREYDRALGLLGT